MDFLKKVLGDKYREFCDIIAEYNRKNPEETIKLADLSQGEFVEKGKYDELGAKYEHDTKELYEKVAKTELSAAVKESLKEAGAKNIKAVKALLDMSAVSLKDGTLNGLEEQIAQLKEEEPYLFEGKKVPKFVRPVGGDGEITREDFKKLSYMEKLKLKKEAPHLYSKLK